MCARIVLIRTAFVFTLAMALVGKVSAQDAGGPSDVEEQIAGCYRIELGDWVEQRATKPPSYSIPERVELLLERTGRRSWLLAPPIAELAGSMLRIQPSWAITESDSLRLTWSTGFSGLSIAVSLPSDTVATGYAETFSDAILVERMPDGSLKPLPRSRASVRMVRIECPISANERPERTPLG